jgi:hypothetical protein
LLAGGEPAQGGGGERGHGFCGCCYVMVVVVLCLGGRGRRLDEIRGCFRDGEIERQAGSYICYVLYRDSCVGTESEGSWKLAAVQVEAAYTTRGET